MVFVCFFLLLSVLWLFFEGFDDQGRGRRHYLSWGLSIPNGQLHWPFQSLFALAMSSPRFFGERPREPILGIRADVAPTATRIYDVDLIGVKIWLHGGGSWCLINWDWDDQRKLHLCCLWAKSWKNTQAFWGLLDTGSELTLIPGDSKHHHHTPVGSGAYVGK